MKLQFTNPTKIFLLCAFLALSTLGFMVKLPTSFRHFDKELHALFYFIAAAFLNILFTNKKVVVHILIFGGLYLFGVSIEYAQQYSNNVSHTRIHGRYDPQDVQYNLKGLIAFSILWIIFVGFLFVYNKRTIKEVVAKGE